MIPPMAKLLYIRYKPLTFTIHNSFIRSDEGLTLETPARKSLLKWFLYLSLSIYCSFHRTRFSCFTTPQFLWKLSPSILRFVLIDWLIDWQICPEMHEIRCTRISTLVSFIWWWWSTFHYCKSNLLNWGTILANLQLWMYPSPLRAIFF